MIGGCRKTILWMSGAMFISALSGFLLLGALARLSSPPVAKPLLAEVFKENLLNSEFTRNFDEAKDHLKTLPGNQPLTIPNFPGILITAGEAAELSEEELTELVSDRVAEKLYLGRVQGTTETLGIDVLTLAPLSAVFSSPAHKTVLRFRIFSLFWTIFWGVLLVVSSRRLGRLFNLGVGMAAGGLLTMASYTLLANRFDVAEELLSLPGGGQINLTPVFMSIKKVALTSRPLSSSILIVGLAFILVSVVVKLAIGSWNK